MFVLVSIFSASPHLRFLVIAMLHVTHKKERKEIGSILAINIFLGIFALRFLSNCSFYRDMCKNGLWVIKIFLGELNLSDMLIFIYLFFPINRAIKKR